MGVLDGVKVLEVAEHGFVPSAAAILAEWGADVVKVERPTGDPLRQIMAMGFVADTGDFNFLFEQFNRNKRGVAIDLRNDDGRAALDRLIEWADVFITNFLPSARDEAAARSRRHLGGQPALRVRDRLGPGTARVPTPTGRLRRGVVLGARRARAHAHAAGRPARAAARRARRRAERRVPRGRGRGRARSSASAPASRRSSTCRCSAPRCGRSSNDLVADHDPRRRSRRATSRARALQQRARRFVPHRRRTLDQPQHARPRPALGADVPRARARASCSTSPSTRPRRSAPSACRELHPIFVERIGSLTARRAEGAAVGRGHDLLDDRVARSRSSTTRKCSRTATCRASRTIRPRGLSSSPMQFDGHGLEIRRGAPEIGEHTDEVFREIGVDDAEIDRLHATGARSREVAGTPRPRDDLGRRPQLPRPRGRDRPPAARVRRRCS